MQPRRLALSLLILPLCAAFLLPFPQTIPGHPKSSAQIHRADLPWSGLRGRGRLPLHLLSRRSALRTATACVSSSSGEDEREESSSSPSRNRNPLSSNASAQAGSPFPKKGGSEGLVGATGEEAGASEDDMVDRLVEKLENSLDAAIKKEHFKDAETLRSELSRLHIDDSSSVLRANSDFYIALSTRNATLMSQVWHDCDTVQCIHPGFRPVVGHSEIVEMWEQMFRSKEAAAANSRIRPTKVHVHVRGTSAFVLCTEEVTGAGVSRKMVATNIFRKKDRDWLLVHHHASQAARGPATPPWDPPGGEKPGVPRIIKIGDGMGGGGSMDDVVKALMGALDGDVENAEGMTFGDAEGSEGEDSEEEEAGGGSDEMIIQSETVDFSTLPSKVQRGWISKDLTWGGGGPFPPPSSGGEYEEASSEKELQDDVTERTLETLRMLAATGKISNRVKTKMMADIVKHHKKGDAASEIEIAYELLVAPFVHPEGGGAEVQECLEDFAEQAKVLARGWFL